MNANHFNGNYSFSAKWALLSFLRSEWKKKRPKNSKKLKNLKFTSCKFVATLFCHLHDCSLFLLAGITWLNSFLWIVFCKKCYFWPKFFKIREILQLKVVQFWSVKARLGSGAKKQVWLISKINLSWSYYFLWNHWIICDKNMTLQSWRVWFSPIQYIGKNGHFWLIFPKVLVSWCSNLPIN